MLAPSARNDECVRVQLNGGAGGVAGLRLAFLGPPRVERDGVPLEVDTRKAIALLAYLAVNKQDHRRDTLATLFWPEYDQSHARASLRRTLSALKRGLGGSRLEVSR